MSNRFHNKFHRHNHHTDATNRDSLYPDSAYDPIASFESPFLGNFYLSGNLIDYKSAYIHQDLFVAGETTRLDTNVFITSATDIFVTNVTDNTPALKVTQSGGISGAPLAQFIGNVVRDTGEYTITFDRFGQVGIGTKSPTEILHVKQQSAIKDGVLRIESISTASVLRLDSYNKGAIEFANYADIQDNPYAIIEGNQAGSVVIKSAESDTITIIESVSGNSYILERIGNESFNEGGFIVESNGITRGKIIIDQTGSTHIQTGNNTEDVIVAYSTKDVLMTGNVAVSGNTTINQSLSVLGDSTVLDTNVFITSAVNISYTGLDTSLNITQTNINALGNSLTITQSNTAAISKFTNANSDARTILQSNNGISRATFESTKGNKIDFYNLSAFSPYFTMSADNILSALKLYSSNNIDSEVIIESSSKDSILTLKSLTGGEIKLLASNNIDSEVTIESSSKDSILTLKSLTGGRINFQQSTSNDPFYSIAGSPVVEQGLKLTSSLSSTLLCIESISGDSLTKYVIGHAPNRQTIGGLTVTTASSTGYPAISSLGSFTVDLSGVVHITSRFNPDAITIVPDDTIDADLYSKVGISVTSPNKELTVKGEISATNLIWDSKGNSGQWNSVYTTVSANSANWQSTFTSVRQNSATWDTVVLKLPLSGGTLTGLLELKPNGGAGSPAPALKVWGDVTIYGNLTSTGLQEFANTIFTTTSSISVVHAGEGTALFVRSRGSGDIASFYDGDTNVEILHVGGTESFYPNVGIKTSSPNEDFTVNGSISSNEVIYSRDSNSSNWRDVYTTVKAISANWTSTYTTVSANSAIWGDRANFISTHTTVKAFSGLWGSTEVVDLTIASVSADSNKNIFLSDVSIDQEITKLATGVTFVSSFTNSHKGNTYTLTNKTTASIDILQSSNIFIRQGHSWRATTSNYSNSFLTLPMSGSCSVRFDANNKASIW